MYYCFFCVADAFSVQVYFVCEFHVFCTGFVGESDVFAEEFCVVGCCASGYDEECIYDVLCFFVHGLGNEIF